MRISSSEINSFLCFNLILFVCFACIKKKNCSVFMVIIKFIKIQ